MLPALLHTAGAATWSILFLGNSHTALYDVPGQVRALLETTGRRVVVGVRTAGSLEDLAKNREVREQVASDRWTLVVLQGAQLSQSHRYEYPQDGALELAAAAVRRGARLLWFAEWPRKELDETPYILGIYAKLARRAGGEVVPLGYATEAAAKRAPAIELWAADGNHASAPGAYLAALTLSVWIHRGPLDAPLPMGQGVDARAARLLHEASNEAWRRARRR